MPVAIHAPASAATNAPAAAGSTSLQSIRTWRMKRAAALVVPARPASLPVPSSVGCGVLGKAANSAGNWMSPPPPAMASTMPAPKAATRTKATSMPTSPDAFRSATRVAPEPDARGLPQWNGCRRVVPVLDQSERHRLRRRQAHVARGYVGAREPADVLQFLVRLCHGAGRCGGREADHQRGRKRPGLRRVVPGIDDGDAGFLEHLSQDGILEALARLDESRDRRVTA